MRSRRPQMECKMYRDWTSTLTFVPYLYPHYKWRRFVQFSLQLDIAGMSVGDKN